MRFRLGQTKGWQCNGHEQEGHASDQEAVQIFILLLLVATVVKYEDGNTREEVRKQRKVLHRLNGYWYNGEFGGIGREEENQRNDSELLLMRNLRSTTKMTIEYRSTETNTAHLDPVLANSGL